MRLILRPRDGIFAPQDIYPTEITIADVCLPPPVKSTVYWVTVWGYGWVTGVRVRITVMVRLRG